MNYQILFHPSGERLLWGISIDVIFTISTPIFIFIAGYLVNRWNENRKEKKRLDELENYFYSLVQQIKLPVMDQIKIFKEIAEDIANQNKSNFTYKENINLDVTNLLNIQHQDLHKIFIGRKKGGIAKNAVHLNNITNTLNYLGSLKINARKNMDKFYSEFNLNDRNWANAYNTILEHYESYVSSNIRSNVIKLKDDFLSEFESLMQNWHQYDDKNNINVAYKYFIIPLRALCNKYRGDERAYRIAQLINQAESAFKSIGYYRKTYSDQFTVDASNLEAKFNSFESAIKYFS